MFVPVSPSGTGKTLSSSISVRSRRSRSTARRAQRAARRPLRLMALLMSLPEMAETARRHGCAVEADVVTGADLTDPPPAYSRLGRVGRSGDEAVVLSPVEDPAQRDLLRGPGSLAGRCRAPAADCRAPAADCRAPAADCRTSTAGGCRPGQVPGRGQQRVDEL